MIVGRDTIIWEQQIDYKKDNDTIPHSWNLESLKLAQVTENIVGNQWRTRTQSWHHMEKIW